MLSGPFALALAAGMAATVNPCGFAMLPAYLAMFLGDDTGAGRTPARNAVPRAVAVSAVLTAGFVAVFGLFGLVISPLAVQVEQYLPWVTIVIGIALVGLGVALLAGRQLTVHVPKLARGGTDRGLRSMFLFGVSYAVASLSCTIGPFLAVTSTTLSGQSVASGVAVFVIYGLGMGLVITVLTVAVAVAKVGLAARLRRAMPHVSRISGGLLLVAGAYVAWYGWFEVRVLAGGDGSDPVIDRALGVQQWLQHLLVSGPPVATALWLMVPLVGVAAGSWLLRRRRRTRTDQHPTAGQHPTADHGRTGDTPAPTEPAAPTEQAAPAEPTPRPGRPST